jgi:hypothetical protein
VELAVADFRFAVLLSSDGSSGAGVKSQIANRDSTELVEVKLKN